MWWPFSTLCQSKARMDGKTVVITGAETGIGKETARDLYWRGARVVIACRDPVKSNAAAADLKSVPPSQPDREQFVGKLGEIVFYKLDLSILATVRECAEHISATESAVHILINNAGIAICPKSRTADGFEMHLATNHLGPFLFTLLLLPKIIQSRKESEPCRIVNVASLAHTTFDINFEDLMSDRSYTPYVAYCQSKLASVLFARELARRLKEANITGVNTYSLHPGVIDSGIMYRFDETWFPGARFLYGLLSPLMKTVEQGAQTSLHCAVDEEAGKETGLYYTECAVREPSKLAQDDVKAARLWDESIKLVGLPSNDLPKLIGKLSN